MAMRGDQLREHIAYVAKDVFLELGFERASMDVIAARAGTTKRTLYAHFENKEKLYLAVVALVRGLFLNRLKTPSDYSEDTSEALVLFCGQFMQVSQYGPAIRMCRLSMAEAERFPEGAAQYFDVMFSAPHERLSAYLAETFGLSAQAASVAAQGLLGCVVYPRFLRALLGIDGLSEHLIDDVGSADVDLEPVRIIVAKLIKSLDATVATVRSHRH